MTPCHDLNIDFTNIELLTVGATAALFFVFGYLVRAVRRGRRE